MPQKDEKHAFSVIFLTRIWSTVNTNTSTEVCLLLSRGLWRYLSCSLHVNTVFENLYRLPVPSHRQDCLTLSCFAFCWRRRRRLKEEERKCLHQRPASIFPSITGEDWSLPWLISRLMWQDMLDLIKTFGKKPGPNVKAEKPISPLTRNSITKLNSSFFCRFVTFTGFRKSTQEFV